MATIENVYLIDDMGEGDLTTLTMFFMVNDAMDDSEKALITETLGKGETYKGGGGASPLFWLVPYRAVAVGDRFVISQEVERYPHFNAAVGLTGTVSEIFGGVVMGKMDLPLTGAEEWDNSIQFYDGGQTAVGALADFCWHTAPTDAPIAKAPPPKYLVEFPDFGPLDVTIPDGFEDSSWHNDACPSWINETLHLRLMIDHADRSKSEVADLTTDADYLRFSVMWMTEDNQITGDVEQSDFATYDEALAVIIAEQFVHELKGELTVRAWEEIRRRNRIYVDKGDDSCASHEFCDANMPMELAFRLLGLLHDGNDDDWANEETPESKRLVGLWNAAWKIAKTRHLTASNDAH